MLTHKVIYRPAAPKGSLAPYYCPCCGGYFTGGGNQLAIGLSDQGKKTVTTPRGEWTLGAVGVSHISMLTDTKIISGGVGKYGNVYTYTDVYLSDGSIRTGFGQSMRYYTGTEGYAISGTGFGAGYTASIGGSHTSCYLNLEVDLNGFTGVSVGSLSKSGSTSVDNRYSIKADTGAVLMAIALALGGEQSQSQEFVPPSPEYVPTTPQPAYGY